MSSLMKKRSREYELSQDFPKRFQGETEQQILHLLEDFVCIGKLQEDEESVAVASEEVVTGVMKSLQEEIELTCSSFYEGCSGSSGLSRDKSVSSEMTSDYGTAEGGIDLCYLLEASDDELGIPPSPVVDMEAQPVFSREEEGSEMHFVENPQLKSFVDNWHFEDDFVDYTQFTALEDPAAGALDFVSQEAFIDGDYSSPWRLETACDILLN